MNKAFSAFCYMFGFIFILGGLTLVTYVCAVYFRPNPKLQKDTEHHMNHNFARHHPREKPQQFITTVYDSLLTTDVEYKRTASEGMTTIGSYVI